MSDGQTFYAVMMLLYLCSCIKSQASQSVGVRKNAFRGWRFHPPATEMAGIKKAFFIAPLLPWPSALLVSEPQSKTSSRRYTISSSLRLIRLVHRASSDLRLLSLNVFIFFFGVIPYSYYMEGASNKTFTAIGVSFFLIFLVTARYIGLHRRFNPLDKGERYKQIFLALTMPWHAMRISDELLLSSKFSSIHPLALVSISNDLKGKQYLAKALRDSIYLKKSTYIEQDVRTVFQSLNINTDPILSNPSLDSSSGSTSYCPCCHTSYLVNVKTCSDCDDTPLEPFK